MPSATPQVLNESRREGHPRAVRIGEGTPWENPFVAGRDGSRDDVVRQFDLWVRHSPDQQARRMRESIGQLIGRDLLCVCAPRACHGDVLISMAARAAAMLPQPVGWMRVTLPVADISGRVRRRTCFGIAVSGYTREDVIVDAAPVARWMIGRTCREAALWIRAHQGTAVRLDRLHEQLDALAARTCSDPVVPAARLAS